MTPIPRNCIAYQALIPIAEKLHKLDEDLCNFGGNDHSEADEDRMMAQAQTIITPMGLKVFHQSDPRGCSLYIIDSTMNDSNYSNGQAVYAD